MSERIARGMNAHPEPDGSILITMHFGTSTGDFVSESVRITHDDGWSLLGNLMNTLRLQSGERMSNAVAGDCETCRNHRVFNQPIGHGGRMEYAHCPDCWDRYNAATPAYPKPVER